ncbi:MAG: hypothetical protein ACPG63_09165, partial [Luminiphilus sp.]
MKRFIGWVVPTVLAQTLLFNPIAVAQSDADAQGVDVRVEQRAQYRQALEELRTGIGPRYRTLREQLSDYPLALYLDYEALIGQLHDLQPGSANRFLADAAGSPLQERFRRAYLLHKGRDRHWREFLGVAVRAPRDPELQCYYYRAQRTVGDKQL